MAGPTKNELEIMEKMTRRIPGCYGRKEGRFLYRLARRRGNLVEIGCYQGRTTAIMQMAAQKWGATLTSIDTFGAEAMPARYKETDHTPETWRANLQKIGLKPPELLHMTSDEATQIYNRPIHLLFIDGNHSERQVARDLRNWTPKIAEGGFLVLHDMFFPTVKGVARAVGKWWNGKEWRLIDMVEYTLAFRKVGK